MNNLSELQGELHKLSAALDALSRQVEDLKPGEADAALDFTALEALARQKPIRNPALAKAGKFEQDLYLRLASTAAFLEDSGQLDKLLYLSRLSVGSGCGQPAAELQKMAYDTQRLDWQSAAGELRELALPLLLDMLMLGGLAGPADERTLDFIASAAELMGVSEEDLTVTAKLAAVLLAQDQKAFGKIAAARAYPELGYLVPEEWLISVRFSEGKYQKEEESCGVCAHKEDAFWADVVTIIIHAQECMVSGTFVNAGTELIVHEQEISDKIFQSEYEISELIIVDPEPPPPIKATRSGAVFFMEESPETKEIFIGSPFDTQEAFLEWYYQQQK